MRRDNATRRPRGREQENRQGQNSATGAIFRVNIHKLVLSYSVLLMTGMIKQSERRNKPRGGPGKAFRAGMSLIELFDLLPNEDSARA